jgi:hypothetical protein
MSETYLEGAEMQYRSQFQIGDIVRVRNLHSDRPYYLAQITEFRTEDSETGEQNGRIVTLDTMVGYPGTDEPASAISYGEIVEWEIQLSPAQPGDIGAYMLPARCGDPGTMLRKLPGMRTTTPVRHVLASFWTPRDTDS